MYYNCCVTKKKEKKLSIKKVKSNFSTVGFLLIIYVLFIMIIPYFFHYYLIETNSPILKDDLLYYGIYFLVIVFGTFIPFFIMRKFSKIKLKHFTRSVNATFVDLFVQTIVFFTICFALTYVSNIIMNRFGMESKLISSIGFSYDEKYLSNVLYVFMLLVVSPIVEEYAFRGVLLNFLSRYNKNFAIYASAIIYALAHSNFAEFLPAFARGVSFSKTSLRYKSIQPTIIMHILFNLFIYSLFIIPSNVASYMAYGLVIMCILAGYLYLSGRYERISIQKSTNTSVPKLFFSRATVIISMLLMIAYTCLMTFIVY